jgi:uncharacterized protein (DUF736 family)
MAFEVKPNTGALFPNNEKKTDKYPDMRGDVHLDKTFLIQMMDKSKGATVKISLGAWKKESKDGLKFLSLAASEPYEKTAEATNSNPWE